jgi:hypothetical protein
LLVARLSAETFLLCAACTSEHPSKRATDIWPNLSQLPWSYEKQTRISSVDIVTGSDLVVHQSQFNRVLWV